MKAGDEAAHILEIIFFCWCHTGLEKKRSACPLSYKQRTFPDFGINIYAHSCTSK